MVQPPVQVPDRHFWPVPQSESTEQRTGTHWLEMHSSEGEHSLELVQVAGGVPKAHSPLESQKVPLGQSELVKQPVAASGGRHWS